MIPRVAGKIPISKPEEVFAAKYSWLLRWALRFSKNDRPAAEDLVQETFLKLLLCWDTLSDIDNIEPLLYTLLKYGHLTERRKDRNFSFQNLGTIDFDIFFIRLRMAEHVDRLQLQNELLRILDYLLWQKQSAKYASIFLLRFFHGYFPEEITRICLITRHAVDLNLRYARQEIKSHLAKEEGIYKFSGRGAPACAPRHAPVPAHVFAEELPQIIFAGEGENCPPVEPLIARYEDPQAQPLGHEVLAHIVGCRRCLELVTNSCGLPPASSRSPEDTVGSAPHVKNGGSSDKSSGKQRLAGVSAASHRPLQEIHDNQSGTFLPAANGKSFLPRSVPALIRVALLGVVVSSLFHAGFHRRTGEQPGKLLQSIVAAESRRTVAAPTSVVHERLAISSRSYRFQRDVYRDLQHRRTPKRQQWSKQALQIHNLLDEAHISWQDPLSASNYKAWRDRTLSPVDRVQQSGTGLLTLTTSTSDSRIREESLTVRISDLHPVGRSVKFRDQEVVEIAELSYSVVPWNPESESWFDPVVASAPWRGTPALPPTSLRIPQLPEAQLDRAELQALLVLKHLHADSERLQINRETMDVLVAGIVDTEDRKQQITAALNALPGVRTRIASYSEMEHLAPSTSQPDSVRMVSVASGTSPMESYCERHSVNGEDRRRASYQIVNAATVIARESNQIQRILRAHPPSSLLTDDARELLHTLLTEDAADITAAVHQQEDALSSIQYTPEQGPSPSPIQSSLEDAAILNLQSSKDLLYAADGQTNSAEIILANLVHSFILVRTAVGNLSGVLLSSSQDSLKRQPPQP